MSKIGCDPSCIMGYWNIIVIIILSDHLPDTSSERHASGGDADDERYRIRNGACSTCVGEPCNGSGGLSQ